MFLAPIATLPLHSQGRRRPAPSKPVLIRIPQPLLCKNGPPLVSMHWSLRSGPWTGAETTVRLPGSLPSSRSKLSHQSYAPTDPSPRALRPASARVSASRMLLLPLLRPVRRAPRPSIPQTNHQTLHFDLRPSPLQLAPLGAGTAEISSAVGFGARGLQLSVLPCHICSSHKPLTPLSYN
jgi:hypothetical protein